MNILRPDEKSVSALHRQSEEYHGNIGTNTLPTMKAPIFQRSQMLLLTLAGLFVAGSVLANEMIIPRGSSWRYNNSNQELGGTGWQDFGYNDSGWSGPLDRKSVV